MPDDAWIDSALSNELPVLRAKGEGSSLEFKSEFPVNAADIGKEIAAFASSGGGMILLGVSDSGDLVGIPDAETPEGRDTLLRRIEGICSGTVRPSITPTVVFLTEEEKTVVAITVPNGTQPVYYCQNRPYVRHLTSSRPAEPHEMIDLVSDWLAGQSRDERQDSPELDLLFELSVLLADILILHSEISSRNLNPWLEHIHAQFGFAADQLRTLAASDAAERLQISDQLIGLAEACDPVASFRHCLGQDSWRDFLGNLSSAATLAEQMMDTQIESRGFTQRTMPHALETLKLSIRQLEIFQKRIDELVQRGEFDDLRHEASRIGENILRLCLLGLKHAPGLDLEALSVAARDLHLVETERIFIDGGASVDRIVKVIQDSTAAIRDVAESALAQLNE